MSTYLTPYEEALAQFNHDYDRTRDMVNAGVMTMQGRSDYLNELLIKIQSLAPAGLAMGGIARLN